MKLPFAARDALKKKKSILKRNNPKATKNSLKVRLLLQKSVRAKLEAVCAQAEKKREIVREQKAFQAKVQAASLESKAVALIAVEKKKVLAGELSKLPRKFNSTDCGQELKGGGNKTHQTSRQKLVERLKLRAPPLPAEVEALWPHIRNNYCRQIALFHGEYVGCFIVKEVNAVIAALGKHFTHPDPAVFASKMAGDPKAFERFVAQMRTQWPELKDANETCLL